MNRRTAIRSLLSVGAAALVPPPTLFADDFVLRSEARLVLLDVSVKDRSGGFVTGLTEDQFHVYENDVPQKITVFANNELPVSLGIVVDESRSMTPKRTEVIAAASVLIEESNPEDEVFVLHFNDVVKRGLPGPGLFSGDRAQLRAALERGVPEGRTALYDAVLEGIEIAGIGHRGKKALVLISDGGDNASSHRRRSVIDRIERSIVTVYAIGLFTPNDPDRDPGLLKQLARISGGEALFPANPAFMTETCQAIAKDMRTRYTVGYVPLSSNGPGPLRRIRVRLSVPGRPRLEARTRSVYRYAAGHSEAHG